MGRVVVGVINKEIHGKMIPNWYVRVTWKWWRLHEACLALALGMQAGSGPVQITRQLIDTFREIV